MNKRKQVSTTEHGRQGPEKSGRNETAGAANYKRKQAI